MVSNSNEVLYCTPNPLHSTPWYTVKVHVLFYSVFARCKVVRWKISLNVALNAKQISRVLCIWSITVLFKLPVPYTNQENLFPITYARKSRLISVQGNKPDVELHIMLFTLLFKETLGTIVDFMRQTTG